MKPLEFLIAKSRVPLHRLMIVRFSNGVRANISLTWQHDICAQYPRKVINSDTIIVCVIDIGRNAIILVGAENAEVTHSLVGYTDEVKNPDLTLSYDDRGRRLLLKFGDDARLQIKFESSVIVYNYTKGIKAFYMKLNEDKKTVDAMNVLVPKTFAPLPDSGSVVSSLLHNADELYDSLTSCALIEPIPWWQCGGGGLRIHLPLKEIWLSVGSKTRGYQSSSGIRMEASNQNTVPSIVVYVTVPNKEAGKKLAASIVKEKLAACVNRVAGMLLTLTSVESVYLWQGEVRFFVVLVPYRLTALNIKIIQTDSEELLIIKTRESLLNDLTEHVKANHEYDVPEVIALPITGGSVPYLEWLKNSTRD
ncbi:protein CutA, chloroplastic [Tanacetum coccineum]|uniref:Protein CutA, chloroplastic n=1 Tax=Tanacetum coccineum TaxID=301880 RepID=A0ABQ5FMJ2_9ASTR